ncbi:unnamed protein product [Polarella glacialis]|uniref:Eukaryotic translation initiation factor 5B n=1 Tax=Polarella glacialis TaxID=89957 RepID=A0A813J604_POLGL|nr:unnamed protein product [Polarella glacialis]CAE8667158.1 unnamed protein product [Polarella glacialis]|mmetsp:Transcript_13234/g.20965  ORF Transcript_13234/g.20965 Transcript_13234/m.20965 type:complete len:1227 (+) Transcript_13234:233-3913(+)
MPKKQEKKQEPPSDESESEPEDVPVKKPAKSNFALMADSDDEDEEEEAKPDFGEKKKKKPKDAEAEELANVFGEKKKKPKEDKDKDDKEKKDKKEKKNKEEKKEKKEKKKRGPIVCEVVSVTPIPKKDKLRVCKIRISAAADTVDIVTSAPNVVAGKKFLAAGPGVTTANGIEVKEAKVGGVDSCGMFCGPQELGWPTDELDANLAIMLPDSAELGSPGPSYEEVLQALKEEKVQAAKEQKEKEEGNKKKKGKKGKDDKDDDDLDAVLAEFKGDSAGPEPTAAAKADAKKKDKKKGGKKEAEADDGFDDLLNEFKPESPEAPEKPSEKPPQKSEVEVPEAAKEDEVDDDAGLDAKALANKKKKDKKKAVQAKAKAVGGEGMWGNDDAEDAKLDDAKPDGDAPEAPAAAKKPAEKGGKPEKKESAIVKAARERMEEERKLHEERKVFEDEQRRVINEEARKEKEEEDALEAERQKKRDARAAKIQKQKDDGTFLTKTQKMKAQRARQLREQFGFTLDADDDEADEEAPKAKPMATKLKKKKPQPGDKADQEDEKKADEEEPEEKDEPPQKSANDAKPEVKETKTAEADGDDWEEIEEKAEAAKKEGSDDESSGSESGSESGSGSDSDSNSSADSFMGYRSPIICIMGHVDTGKTKLLDKIRKTNVQEGEAGGITQQIGATFFPDIALLEQTKKVDPEFELEVPGLLIIDTPGHEAFNNLRMRGSSLCDLAILVIDIMHGLEPQTVESLEMLKKRRCPFIIALNKVDVLYQWNSKPYTSIQEALARQEQFVRDEFQQRFSNIMLQLNERGLNCSLYFENEDYRSAVSIIPTSALTGEGVPDLLFMLLKLTQNLMSEKLECTGELQCTVIEVKNIEGLGTTIDVVLVNGTLKEGDQIVLAGMNGPIVTTIRALLTPQPMKEMRVKGEYVHHAKISTSMGVKICAPGLDDAVAGSEMLVVGPDDDIEELKEQVDDTFESILNGFEKQPVGVYVKASTLGSLEALLGFLADMKIPVFDVGIGEVHKKDVKKASIMKEKKKEYAVILAFDVKVNAEATKQAISDDVAIFTADIIYHLQDKFKTYMEKFHESQKVETRKVAIFPVVLQIDKNYVFRKTDPIIVGCQVVGGQLRIGTPICVPEKDNLNIGTVIGIEKDHKAVTKARRGDSVCVKIDQNTAQTHITYGRHFDHTNQLYAHITRESIDTLKTHFKDEMNKEDWELVIGLKTIFKID